MLSSYLYCAHGKVKPLLYDSRQFPDPASLLSQDILRASGQDNDLCPGGRHSDLNPTVTILRQLLGEKVVQLCFKNTISNKLHQTYHEQRYMDYTQTSTVLQLYTSRFHWVHTFLFLLVAAMIEKESHAVQGTCAYAQLLRCALIKFGGAKQHGTLNVAPPQVSFTCTARSLVILSVQSELCQFAIWPIS